jgi:hypothetical protein
MAKTISMKTYFSLPVPTSITIIGLGDTALIQSFREFTGTKFPIYTDPSRKLHRLLGMSWSINLGRRPEYQERTTADATGTWLRQINSLPEDKKEKKYKGGGLLWTGGEFLIKDGKVVWCHRMKTYRDHVEMDVIKDLLGIVSA